MDEFEMEMETEGLSGTDELSLDPFGPIRSAMAPEFAGLPSNEVTLTLGRMPAAIVLHQVVNSPATRQATLAGVRGDAGRRSVRVHGSDIAIPAYLRIVSRLCEEVAEKSEAERDTGSMRAERTSGFGETRGDQAWSFENELSGSSEMEQGLAIPQEESEFRLDRLPAGAKARFAKTDSAAWREAVDQAIASRVSDAGELADLIFFMQHRDRVVAGVGKPILRSDADFLRLRAEWDLYETIAKRRLNPGAACSVFLPDNPSNEYEQYVNPPTTGRITFLLNGRTSGVAHTEAFDEMQKAVESLGSGDSIYLSAFMLNPTKLTVTRSGMATWGDLFVSKARAGVKIRILLTGIPDPGPDWRSNIEDLKSLVGKLTDSAKENLKFVMSMHPARLNFKEQLGFDIHKRGVFLKAVENVATGGTSRDVGTHHQKFMVVRKSGRTIAFCGGLDISPQRTPEGWSSGFIWHDIHTMLEGRIARELEREFVLRWNQEKSKTKSGILSGWKSLEELKLSSVDRADQVADKNTQKLQMLRTVSVGATTADVRRDDVWQGYFKLIGCARKFLYIENQYLHEVALAKAIVKQTEAEPSLIVMVVVSADTDDPENPFTEHGRAQQNECFTTLFAGIAPDRLRVYSMHGRLVHSKLILIDDRALSIGSTNADPRDFFMDTQLNVMLDDPKGVTLFRHKLWSHDLAVSEEIVKSWGVGEFMGKWDEIAKANEKLTVSPDKLPGEGVISFDPRTVAGKRSRIADVLTELNEGAGEQTEGAAERQYIV
jgi:phosphatidylserine/phosphatidylglycerophosphate/cardiolipin synthase-like enzyme